MSADSSGDSSRHDLSRNDTNSPFAATIRADILQDALGPVAALVMECKIRPTDDGLQITAVDAANVGMIDLEIEAGAFAAYESDVDVLGVDLERLTDILSMADSDEFVHLELDSDRKLHIQMGGLEFTIALIDPDSIRDEPDLPDLDLPGTYVFEASEFSRAVTAADLVGDHVEIEGVSESELAITAEGDTDDVDVTIGDDELLNGVHQADSAVSSLFSLDYLADMEGPMSSDTEVSIRLGDEFPAKLKYSLADGDVSVVNMLAPRISSEG